MLKPHKEQFHTFEETSAGVFGLFDTPAEIIAAAAKTKEKNYTGFDCFTPFPVHGLDDAMGVPRSGLPWVTFFMGLFGCAVGFGMQYLTHKFDWPINISGKNLNAWFAYIPITFEFTVFMAGIGTAAAMFFLTKLPKVNRRILHPDITTDKFALWIPSSSKDYKEDEVVNFIKSLGGKNVEVVK
ncbi:DUF3341 domain-containing protein [Leptospira borgpetersenii]|uniref:DUF3341 domain-containing protein n=1 Tax=Leptospira borgpetersenii TaxID=174 RepID=UPI00034DABE6|nr:DUF3341 domain-containing protein [Leptospira borgpetersenii]URD69275.1 DUF3341 domain-containing protein [Leptospira borgpetersenii]UVD72450.1 DUF3341 domain-containing protein [Leptospira borgpetersenii]UVD75640.1 DUF3341 domain-containing protein [Leptospira borgpetersenii]UZW32201.1 DUF3341 domain-containing protein [Leptospira borgpetersenii]